MKRSISAILAASLVIFALPSLVQAQATYTAFSGVSLLTSVPATSKQVSGVVRLPTFSGIGTLNITESGAAGSPSGCSIALAYVQNNSTTATSAAVTQAFTPANGVQQFNINPVFGEGDQYQATYNCSSTFPTAGTITVSFSPALMTVTHTVGGDPCVNPNVVKSSVVINTSGAGTTQLVPVAAGKAIYACSVAAGISATTATIAFESGGSTTCTSPTALTGTIVPTAGMWLTLGYGGTIFTAPAGSGLCVVNGGTGTQIGVLTYVQQ
jgi:hypothetical protein